MEPLIFKTDLKSRKRVRMISSLFDNNPLIQRWSVDSQDIDNVLRIETKGILKENDVIKLVRTYGFDCEVLPD